MCFLPADHSSYLTIPRAPTTQLLLTMPEIRPGRTILSVWIMPASIFLNYCINNASLLVPTLFFQLYQPPSHGYMLPAGGRHFTCFAEADGAMRGEKLRNWRSTLHHSTKIARKAVKDHWCFLTIFF